MFLIAKIVHKFNDFNECKLQIKYPALKLVNKIIFSNIFLPIAAVLLTVSTQVQLGMQPHWQPYLFLIFLATIFEYNRHRIFDVIIGTEDLNSVKYQWIRNNLRKIYFFSIVWFIAFIITIVFTKTEVLLALVPLGIVTVFYSVPSGENKKYLFRLREIPYLKIFLIAFVWSASTIFLPVIQAEGEIYSAQVILLFAERFFFIFAITIPFDIRDMQADRKAGIKTIPLLVNQKKALALSYLSLSVCLIISIIHYRIPNNWFIIEALCISLITTYLLLRLNFFKNWSRYYYQILDGTLLLQGMLVLVFYFLNHR